MEYLGNPFRIIFEARNDPRLLIRVRLCVDYSCGGLSADPAILAELKKHVSIPVFVMIRPHSRNFFYDEDEFDIMKSTMAALTNCGADGFVFGILESDTEGNTKSGIDVKRNKALVDLAGGKPCTFHRAFDCIPEERWSLALNDLATCGFASILTSGGPSGNTAVECVDKLSELFQTLDLVGSHLPVAIRTPEIIVGGGVRSSNVRLLFEKTNGRVFHSSASLTSPGIVEVDEVRELKRALGIPAA